MAFTWGSTTLKVIVDTYKPPHSEAGLVGIDLLPDSADSGANCEVLQQFGRKRKRASFSGFVTSQAEFDSLEADYLAQTERTFTDINGLSLGCTIESIAPSGSVPGNTRKIIYYDIVLVEA
ncbi:hypothetical protein ACOBQJ_13150 [Pelotomaculum propionicicum]|uniref:hypothetical protein n=1 Tax=Pelotomaculum propionicicum TaxID=258475 RepID=UPI003B7A9F8D